MQSCIFFSTNVYELHPTIHGDSTSQGPHGMEPAASLPNVSYQRSVLIRLIKNCCARNVPRFRYRASSDLKLLRNVQCLYKASGATYGMSDYRWRAFLITTAVHRRGCRRRPQPRPWAAAPVAPCA